MNEGLATSPISAHARRAQRVANWSLAAWISLDAIRCFITAAGANGWTVWSEFALGLVWLVNASFVIRREPPTGRLQSRWKTAVIAASLLLPVGYLFVSVDPSRVSIWLSTAEWLSTASLLWSIVALGRNFSVLPQRRRIVRTGPYAIVRHPIYASYLVFDLLYCFSTPGILSAALWMTEVLILYLRARWEEEVLREDEAYRAYCRMVRSRFIPGIA